MKSFVFSIKHKERYKSPESYHTRHPIVSLKRFFTYYGIESVFAVLFLLGVILGSFSLRFCSDTVLKKLDILFLTNIENRLEFSAFDIFCSSFASNFIFLLFAFLLSFTVWGSLALPFLCAFKGFCVGVSSTLMFSQHSLAGIGFFVLIVLPGTVMFLLSYLSALKEAFTQSLYVLRMFSNSFSGGILIRHTKRFLFRYFVFLIFTALCAVVDMLLWVLFANMFNF